MKVILKKYINLVVYETIDFFNSLVHYMDKNMNAILIALFIGMFMFSCTPINNLEDPQKDVDTVVDPKLLLGY